MVGRRGSSLLHGLARADLVIEDASAHAVSTNAGDQRLRAIWCTVTCRMFSQAWLRRLGHLFSSGHVADAAESLDRLVDRGMR